MHYGANACIRISIVLILVLLFVGAGASSVFVPSSLVARAPAAAVELRRRTAASLACLANNSKMEIELQKLAPGVYPSCSERDARSLLEMCVPRIIHHTWATPDPPLEEQNVLLTFAEDWLQIVWDDKAIEELIEGQLPSLWPLYRSYPVNIMRADAARLIVAYFYGGIYADMDFEIFVAVESVMKLTRGIGFLGHADGGVSAAMFVSQPRHPYLEAALQLMPTSYEEAKHGKGWFLFHMRVINTNGPNFIRKVKQRKGIAACWLDYHRYSPCDGCGVCQPDPWWGYHHMSGRWHHWSSALNQAWSCYRARTISVILFGLFLAHKARRHLLIRQKIVAIALAVLCLLFVYVREPRLN